MSFLVRTTHSDLTPNSPSSPGTPRLRLHRYAGREQGFMILATRESMERLVAQIGDGLASNADATIRFPKLLANCEAVGFDNTGTAYAPSFHIDTEPPFRRLPWQRAFGSAWAFGLTLIGAVAIVALISEHLR